MNGMQWNCTKIHVLTNKTTLKQFYNYTNSHTCYNNKLKKTVYWDTHVEPYTLANIKHQEIITDTQKHLHKFKPANNTPHDYSHSLD